MNIFEISQELLSIFDELEENDGELTPELEEQLTISQADFKTKVEAYTNVIKQAEGDIDCVDKEIKRLQAVKKSKQASIDRLKKIIIWAVEMFGETNKSGNKFYDYGKGKISIRNTEKVEVNSDVTEAVICNFLYLIDAYKHNNQLDIVDSIDTKEVVNYVNEELNEDEELQGYKISVDDLNNINANLSFNIPITELLSGKGFELLKELSNNVNLQGKSYINKTELKKVLSENPAACSGFAYIMPNKTLTIK